MSYKSDNVEYRNDMIIEAGNCWLNDLKAKAVKCHRNDIGAEVNDEIKVADLREEIDMTWKKDIDNSGWACKANYSGIKTISNKKERFSNGGVVLKNVEEVKRLKARKYSYASLDHDQEAGIINRNLIGNINYDGYIINGKSFERNHEPNRGDIDFKDEIHGSSSCYVNTNNLCNRFV
ncbi:6160_t:CDS:2 [Gigaspora rosea]|nr:6160_t:CDS:2 [Gigaspora rosea]